MGFINKVKQKYLDWKEHIFLKSYGCKTREQYERWYDPDYNIRATRIKDYYHGYPYVYCFENHDQTVYFWDLGYDGRYVIHKWCKANLKDKFRFDHLRVLKNNYTQEWEINELGGGDYIFIAFKSEQDMMWFTLRWS